MNFKIRIKEMMLMANDEIVVRGARTHNLKILM